MKRNIIILVIFLSLVSLSFSQPDLTVVWQKNIFPTEISYAKFSADGNYIYCAVGNTIQKMDAAKGEFISTFDNVDTLDRKSTRLNSSHSDRSRMPSSA